jgi:hypothetical protein
MNFAELEAQVKNLRQKCHNQKQELRRLNAAHLLKNARILNLELENVAVKTFLQRMTGLTVERVQNVRPVIDIQPHFTVMDMIKPGGTSSDDDIPF